MKHIFKITVTCIIIAGLGESTSIASDVSIGAVFRPQGTYEIRVVPNTLDLVRHAELALNVLTRTNNPNDSYNTYFNGKIIYNPPRLYMSWEPAQWKLAEPLMMMRLMTGNMAHTDVDDGWASWLHDLGNKFRQLHVVYIGRGLVAISFHYRLTGDPAWKETGRKVVDRLIEVCPRIDDFAFYPPNMDFQLDPTRSRKLSEYHDPFPTGWPAMGDAWIVQGLCTYYRETGYQPAIDLAGRLVRHMRYHGKIFDEDGRFIAAHDGYKGPNTSIHFYRHANTLLSFAEYALVTGDKSYAEFTHKSYEYARSTGTPEIGFFPEYLGEMPDDRHGIVDSESCGVGHMISIGLRLTAAGVGDYWDDVDRYLRNMLTEMQMKNSRWIEELVRDRPTHPVDPEKENATEAAQRLVGIFAAWASPNEFCVWGEGTTQCCAANPPRALYYVWEQMLKEEPGQLTLELMLNRASATADITSDLPYAGRLDIYLKRKTAVRVRKPGWLDPDTVKIIAHPSGKTVPFELEGKYLSVATQRAGEQLIFTFRLPERTLKTKVGHIDATMTLRGYEVVAFDPPGQTCPFWQDKKVGGQVTPEVVRTYFIQNKTTGWFIKK